MTGTESEIEIGSESETGNGSGSETEPLRRLHGAWSDGGGAPVPLRPPPMREADEQRNGERWFMQGASCCVLYMDS